MQKSLSEKAFEILTSEDDGRACRDIADSACRDQPGNFFKHIFSLSLTKAADGMIDPKLVLSWLLTNAGAPAYLVGLLVPIREAGALLPQLFTASYIRTLPLRKYAWSAGSAVQGICALAIAGSAFVLQGASLGIAVLILLAILAVARSICSVSYKDVLGKTVDKSRRGTATGAATSIAAGFVVVFALLLSSGIFDKAELVSFGLLLAGGFWIGASLLFSSLSEDKGATEGGRNAFHLARDNFDYLKSDKQLLLFIATRGLLIATALAPPFMVSLSASEQESAFAELGLLLLASSLAGISSSFIWGRLADRSSRKVLMSAGLIGGLSLSATALTSISGLLDESWVLPLLLFALMIAYQGVRLGRTTHLVDMADEDRRAAYTALSNTIIGVLLLAGGLFSLIASQFGEAAVLGLFAAMCFAAIACAAALNDVQQRTH